MPMRRYRYRYVCVFCVALQYYYVLSALTTPQWSVVVIQQEGLIAIRKVGKYRSGREAIAGCHLRGERAKGKVIYSQCASH